MGANASREGQEGGQASANAGEGPKDLYTILDIQVSATQDEIKKAFRKAALREHPDKNPNDPEGASRRFLAVQQAYEVLSDEQERAWYDAHKDDLAHGGGQADEDLDLRTSSKLNRAPNISARQLMNFFDTRGWRGFDDGEEGFYSVYRTLFNLIAKDEQLAKPYPGEPPFSHPADVYPSFGHSTSSYDNEVKKFYSIFINNFVSRKSFASSDAYKTTEAPDRRYKRAMEKENKRAREEARKEYNETVRNLASFLKKRDPRFLNSNSVDPLKARALDAERLRYELRQAAIERAKQREEEALLYKEQDWQKVKPAIIDIDNEEDDGGQAIEPVSRGQSGSEAGSDAEDDLAEVQDFWCPACEKQFQSEGAYANHERSKKHIKLLAQLKKQMLEEDEEFGLDDDRPAQNENGVEAESEDPIPPQKSSEIKHVVELPIREEPQETTEALDDVTSSRKQKKKGRRRRQSSASESEILQSLKVESNTPEAEVAAEEEIEVEPQLSKKDKRRAKEAAKKAAGQSPSITSAQPGGASQQACNICKTGFSSRTKLFEHIKKTGHASLKK